MIASYLDPLFGRGQGTFRRKDEQKKTDNTSHLHGEWLSLAISQARVALRPHQSNPRCHGYTSDENKAAGKLIHCSDVNGDAGSPSALKRLHCGLFAQP